MKVVDRFGNLKTSIIGSSTWGSITGTLSDQTDLQDALDTKLDINALPSNLTLYPTSVASDIGGYYKMVTSLDDPDFDNPAVDFVTAAITTTSQLVGSVATTAGVLSGNPGVLPNVGTIGNIKRNSGTGTATFYFEVYHRDSGGTETLIGTSSNTLAVTLSTYTEFEAFVVWNNGTFTPTDRIVIKYYANRIAGGSNPVYAFQFGGSTPTRTIVPVPANVLLDVPIQIGVTEIGGGTSGTLLRNEGGVVGDTDYTVPKTDGTANQVLQTNGAGVVTWQTLATGITIGTTPITSGTAGRVLFEGAGNVVQEDSALFWDNTNKRLGVGATPSSSVRLDVRAQGALSTDVALRIQNSGNSHALQQFNGDGSWLHRNNSNTFYEYYNGTNLIEYRYTGAFTIGTNNDVTSFNLTCNNGALYLRGGSNILNIVSGGNYHFEENSGTLSTTGAGAIVLKNRTAPSSNVVDRFYFYSADQTAGNASPHFRTENGDIQKIYSIGGWGTPSGTLTRTTFDESTVTLAELAQRVAALITDLKTGHQLLKA